MENDPAYQELQNLFDDLNSHRKKEKLNILDLIIIYIKKFKKALKKVNVVL